MTLINKSDLKNNSVAEFINYATHDYIGARILLIQGYSLTGTILAVTAMEKIMKSFLLEEGLEVRRDGKGHNLDILIKQIDDFDPEFLTNDERKFLIHINKAYKLRYPTEINNRFNTFLPSKKLLVNMDSLFHKFIESPTLKKISPEKKWYDMFLVGAMPKSQLTNWNVNFGTDRSLLIKSRQQFVAYFPRNGENRSVFNTISDLNDDGDWSIPKIVKTL